jgi:hypothetical protein
VADTPDQQDTRPTGGYTDAARFLTENRGRPVSKQQVWVWWSRRERNGFPEGWERTTRGGGVRRFYLDEVLAWHLERYPDDPTVPDTT